MLAELTASVKETIQSAARKLTGFRRREFQAEMTLKYCAGRPRLAEATFGWGREAVQTGLNERRSGIRCLDAFSCRGRHKTEAKHPELAQAIHALVGANEPSGPQVPNDTGLYSDNGEGRA